eukprot:TRINITY_DN12154_c0_g1_i1.p2 TRINITY_DN12154_c0_g1~~TRINITY_DN12154_c0_g1_i1.p2  ORF type:complete len:165 (+),score=3.25 TRINITY_DN12154_c0_g1_i1:135-629(+)
MVDVLQEVEEKNKLANVKIKQYIFRLYTLSPKKNQKTFTKQNRMGKLSLQTNYTFSFALRTPSIYENKIQTRNYTIYFLDALTIFSQLKNIKTNLKKIIILKNNTKFYLFNKTNVFWLLKLQNTNFINCNPYISKYCKVCISSQLKNIKTNLKKSQLINNQQLI